MQIAFVRHSSKLPNQALQQSTSLPPSLRSVGRSQLNAKVVGRTKA